MEKYRQVITQLSEAYEKTGCSGVERELSLLEGRVVGVDLNLVRKVLRNYLLYNHSSANKRLFGKFPKEMIDEISSRCEANLSG